MGRHHHDCVMCQASGASWETPVCGRCWRALPEHHRMMLQHSWWRRVIAPAAWQEALATALLSRQGEREVGEGNG